ncbi:MAG: penicillin-binding protein 1C, partial [Candidatus Aminicenantes bacterium]|nr:penicillin-binding protein 1C [Candidatus Aminicenantes bacterium]
LSMLEDKNITNAAIVVLDNRTAEVRALIGSRNFFDDHIDGQVNGALSLRQPGSTLKPFTYGLALDSGLTAATLIEDDEIQFQTPTGSYIPRNYDRKFHGLVRIRTALACSYNVPAVSVIEYVGLENLYHLLHAAGFTSLSLSPEHYGVGLTLGNGEVTLLELAQAYASLARGGNFAPVKTILSLRDPFQNTLPPSPTTEEISILSPQTSYILTHILSDNDARIPAFGYHSPLNLPFPCAAKTGTSKDYRDNWTVGYTTRYTVGVWVGNFDASPMHNVSGITGCGPLFRDIMLFLHKDSPADSFARPTGLTTATVCPVSGSLTSDSCPGTIEELFIQGTEPVDFCRTHTHSEHQIITAGTNAPFLDKPVSPQIRFPVHGDIFKMDPVLRKDYQAVIFRALIPEPLRDYPIEWWINGQKIEETRAPASTPWKLVPGSYSLQIRISAGEKYISSRTVQFTVLS